MSGPCQRDYVHGVRALVAIRSIRVSPFPEEGQAVYFAGYDTNKAPVHTAWIIRSAVNP